MLKNKIFKLGTTWGWVNDIIMFVYISSISDISPEKKAENLTLSDQISKTSQFVLKFSKTAKSAIKNKRSQYELLRNDLSCSTFIHMCSSILLLYGLTGGFLFLQRNFTRKPEHNVTHTWAIKTKTPDCIHRFDVWAFTPFQRLMTTTFRWVSSIPANRSSPSVPSL